MEWNRVLNYVRYNSGTHFLDSGGAYGRWHELPAPAADIPLVYCDTTFPADGATISTAAWLRDYITEATDLTAAFDAFASADDSDDDWFTLADRFMESLGYRCEVRDNVYNNDQDFDQVFVWAVWLPEDSDSADWIYADDAVVVFHIHTGCDVRGGYSPPLFSRDNDCEYAFPLDFKAEYYEVDPTPVTVGQGQLDVGAAADWQPSHGDDGTGFWSVGYSGNPWGEVWNQLGDPDSATMVGDVPQWTFPDGTVVAATYPYQGN